MQPHTTIFGRAATITAAAASRARSGGARAALALAVLAAAGAGAVAAAGPASASQMPVISWSQTTSAGTYDYGTLTAGTTVSKTFTLRNTGGSDTSALTITLTGPAFTTTADSCTGTSLGPGKSCTVAVSYAPASASQTDTGTLTAAAHKAAVTARLALRGASANTVTVTGPGNQTSTAGTATSQQIQASDSASGQTLTYSATGLPDGLSINSTTGLISGTPTTAATSNVTVTATDTTGAHGSAAFTWTVNPAPNTVTVTNPGNQPNYAQGDTVSLQIQASDSASGQTLTYSATGLPDGLSINSTTGLISGTLTAHGLWNTTVTATDTTGAHGSTSFTWDAGIPVTVIWPGNQTSTVGTTVSLQIQDVQVLASGQTLTYSAIGLPAGLSINSATGLISGAGTVPGTWNVTVTVTATGDIPNYTSFGWTVS